MSTNEAMLLDTTDLQEGADLRPSKRLTFRSLVLRGFHLRHAGPHDVLSDKGAAALSCGHFLVRSGTATSAHPRRGDRPHQYR